MDCARWRRRACSLRKSRTTPAPGASREEPADEGRAHQRTGPAETAGTHRLPDRRLRLSAGDVPDPDAHALGPGLVGGIVTTSTNPLRWDSTTAVGRGPNSYD